jgi:hypothetical protein
MRGALVGRISAKLKWLGAALVPLVCVQTGWTDGC